MRGCEGRLGARSKSQFVVCLTIFSVSRTHYLSRTQMQVESKLVNLSPGMAVTVEIKTGSRRPRPPT